MAFTSIQFAAFLIVVFMVYWTIPNRFRWLLLLVTSYYFYMSWNVKYVVLILGTTIISFFAAIGIEKVQEKAKQRLLLVLSSTIVLFVLFLFKYLGFFMTNVQMLVSQFSLTMHPVTLKLLLPVGISFYTFQTIAYVADVYNGKIKAEHHFGKYAAFISFFPQLVAGPIERSENLLPQIKAEHRFSEEKALSGLKQMAWGFFKKLVIADMLATYVDNIFNHVRNYSGFSLLLASLFFTVQIYCDFSGYSDIAIGTAKLLDIDLMTNFSQPYFSQSVHEFWGRWHISLSQWFRDYVYIPLGGNRCSKTKQCRNVLVTFLLSGLWHGANWTYVVWGAIHGVAQVLENLFIKRRTARSAFTRIMRVCVVFFFVSFAWIFFRANSIADAFYVITHLFDGIKNIYDYKFLGEQQIGICGIQWMYVIVPIFVLTLQDAYRCFGKEISVPKCLQWIIYTAFAILILCFRASTSATFVYFQF